MIERVMLFILNSVLYLFFGLLILLFIQYVNELDFNPIINVSFTLVGILILAYMSEKTNFFKDLSLVHPLQLSRLTVFIPILLML